MPLRVAAVLYERAVRRRLVRPPQSPTCPVIVVGNLVAGGSGKTPVVTALAEALERAGFNVSIISRGYGGRAGNLPVAVSADSIASQVGDEALELHRRTGRPVWVCRRRAEALASACAEGAQVVLSDDGLQHVALPRSFEICVIDARRGLGNGLCLPAGPLRQPVERLETVDMVLVKSGPASPCNGLPGTPFTLETDELEPVNGHARPPQRGSEIDAVAGIGDPESFFQALEQRGFRLRRHPLVDHQPITESMLSRLAGPVVMTGKDSMRLARKHSGRARSDLFFLPARANLPAEVLQRVVDHVREFQL